VRAQPRTSARRYNYLVEPFSVVELLARLVAKLRYAAPQAGLMGDHEEVWGARDGEKPGAVNCPGAPTIEATEACH